MIFRDWLLGAWSLLSYSEERPGSAFRTFPFGTEAAGRLIYSADGHMSVLLMRPDRPPFSSGDWFAPTPEEIRSAAAFIAYSGRFSVDEAARTVTHVIDLSFFPNWIGARQTRMVTGSGDDLTLSPATPITSGGAQVVPQLHWRRAASST